MNWTDERVEKLKKLWSEGLSASQIAAQLGGVSRNAVIGKVHRLCLPGRAKAGGTAAAPARTPKRQPAPAAARPANYPARPTAPRAIARPAGNVALSEDVDLDGLEQVAPMPVSSAVLPISKRLSLTDLTERTCKWPVGDPMKEDFHFCGCDSTEGSPYCAYHAKLAYQPVNDRRRAAAAAAAAR
ncbi:GcrA family cell cycle regulator [Rhizobium paknamense]|uniref:GcrA cell cycle regulator n=1 Tax=Rhizobium paknamense TaxID=1206817 RepID=A0ABU0IC75_9HYPH|nr:GcrA family cell cycle regulator [Rhizobium paknamense]MDQ0455228.1 GcrA cell cycle regulator [Rhizobium paknamense]